MSWLSMIPQLILESGRARAAGMRDSGQIWGQAIANIGQQLGGIPMQMAQAREMDAQSKMRALQLQQAQREMDSQKAFEEVLKNPANYGPDGRIDDAKVADALKQRNVGAWMHWNDLATKMQDHELARRKTIAEIATSDANLAEKSRKAQQERDQYLGELGFNAERILDEKPDDPLHARDTALASAARAAGSGYITEQQAKDFMMQTAQASPQQLKQIFGSFVPADMRAKLEKSAAETTEAKARAAKAIQETKNLETYGRTTPLAPKSLQPESVLLDGKPSKVLVNPDPSATDRVFYLSGKPIANPEQRIRPMPPASVLYPKPEGSVAAVEIKPGTPEYTIAKRLADGSLTFPQFRTLVAYSRDAAKKAAMFDLATRLNPAFNPAQFELGYKMAGNAQIRNRIVAINALGPVIDRVDELADQVGNGDIPAWNKVLQASKFAVGNRTVTDFKQMRTLLGEEVGNALGVGTASDLKTRLGLDLVNPNLSAANFKSTMQQLRSVLEARRTELYKQMGIYGDQLQGGPPPAAGSDVNPFRKK